MGERLVWLLTAHAARAWRFLGWAYLALLVLLVATGGKDYYLAPYYPTLFAAGAIAIERWTADRRWRARCGVALPALMLLVGVAAAPLAVPVLPIETYVRYARATGIQPAPSERHTMGRLPQYFADMFGWHELVAEAVRVAAALPPADRAKAVIVARNYGEAGAINFLGRERGAPLAISAHNNYWLWGPGHAEPGRAAHHRRPRRGAPGVPLPRAGRQRPVRRLYAVREQPADLDLP